MTDAAIRAAIDTASRLGITGSPAPLGASKNVSLLFAEAGLVARVTAKTRLPSLVREAAVARHLEAKGAPVVRLADGALAGPHLAGEFALTFWRYARPDGRAGDGITAAAAARGLEHIHDALAGFPDPLPPASDQAVKCRATLADPAALPALASADRALLIAAIDENLGLLDLNAVPLHGDAHADNVVMSAGAPLWLDFEDVCKGPREWDYCRFGEPGRFARLDRCLYDKLARLRSACVATWCWADAAVSAKRDAARRHTAIVRRGFVPN